jgi:hypothetical protein
MPENYEPLDGRRQAVTIIFILIVAASIAALVSDLLEINLLDRVIAGEDVTDAEATANDNRQGLVGLLQFVALVAGAIVFIRWLTAAYRNTDVVSPGTRRYGHGWAIGAWFVPFLNLWRPKQIVNDVWRAGGRDASDAEPGALLVWWWSAFVISNWLANIGVRSWFGDETPQELRDGTVALAVSDGIDIFGAILAILVVKRISDRLDSRTAERATPPEGPLEPSFEAPERPAGLPV